MSIQQAAQAALATFPQTPVRTPRGTFALPVVMLSIGGAENGFGNDPGDPLSIYRDGGASERAYSCGGKTSFGTWQVNLPAHSAMVAILSGIPASNPCGQAAWLANYQNCAKAALAVYRSQGLGAWTTWNTGAYLAYLPQAQTALGALIGSVSTAQASTFVQTGAPYALAALLGGVAVVGGVLALERVGRRR